MIIFAKYTFIRAKNGFYKENVDIWKMTKNVDLDVKNRFSTFSGQFKNHRKNMSKRGVQNAYFGLKIMFFGQNWVLSKKLPKVKN